MQEHGKIIFSIAGGNFDRIRGEEIVGFVEFDDVGPTEDESRFAAQNVCVKAKVIDRKVHPSLAWNFAFPIARNQCKYVHMHVFTSYKAYLYITLNEKQRWVHVNNPIRTYKNNN